MSAQNKLNSTVLDQAAEWTTIVDSGEMSEEQRLDFNTWVDEPHNARELGAMRTLVSLIQELPERKAATLHRMTTPLDDGWHHTGDSGRGESQTTRA